VAALGIHTRVSAELLPSLIEAGQSFALSCSSELGWQASRTHHVA
jgi:hypothetical protein